MCVSQEDNDVIFRRNATRVMPEPYIGDSGDETSPRRYLGTDSAARKRMPIASGLLDYCPDACAAVAEVSWMGNEKHNPGEEMHHARGKSSDHADCIARHLIERGGFELITIKGVTYKVRHSAALAWRAMIHLQEELEGELDLTLPRGAKLSTTTTKEPA